MSAQASDGFGFMVGEDVGPGVRAAFEELAAIPTEPAAILERFTNVELADTAYPGESRRALERRSFMRTLQRWRRGRTPLEDRRGGALRRARRAARRLAMNRLLARVERRGVTVLAVELELVKSERNEANPAGEGARQREIRGPWYVSPDLLHQYGFFPPAYADQWDDAAASFFMAFFDAYGLGEFVIVESLTSLELKVGRP